MGKWKEVLERTHERGLALGAVYPGAVPPSQVLAIIEAINELGERLVPTPDPGAAPPPGVAVLWIWTGQLDGVRRVMDDALNQIYHEGMLGEHPDGGSQGWEWKTP